MRYADDLRAAVSAGLSAHADPARAAAMQRYLKTDMPMFGVGRPDQQRLLTAILRQGAPADAAQWAEAVRRLWAGPERELKYAAIAVTRGWRGRFLDLGALPLLEQLVREGAWWDLVDELAVHPIGEIALRSPAEVRPVLLRWIGDPDLWVRRAALLAQNRHRERADEALLFDLCLRQADDRSFWIRKAIGWALREHARTRADAVRAFLSAHGGALSGLTRREASKHL